MNEWEEKRNELRTRWQGFLGTPPERCKLEAVILAHEQLEGIVREKVRYEVHEGCFVEAYVLRPAKIEGRRPGVAVFHQTDDCTIDEPSGRAGPADLHIGLHLARRGFVVVCPRCFLWDYKGASRDESVAGFQRDFPAWRGMGKMLYDCMRAVDFLCSLDSVDGERIGAIGHSLGGKEAFYLAAFDARVKAAVCSELGIGLDQSNWDAEHYLGAAIGEPGFDLDHKQVLSLIAPRALLLIAGGGADDERSLQLVTAVRTIYQRFGAGDRLAFLNHHGGHAFPAAAQEAAYEWLEKWLAQPRRLKASAEGGR
ncbi:MAG: dienelactone hydrolase family protein [Planctomycetia bacterium]|nr:dienelactone hydrolase family protein [Planctomycetia bacterium]